MQAVTSQSQVDAAYSLAALGSHMQRVRNIMEFNLGKKWTIDSTAACLISVRVLFFPSYSNCYATWKVAQKNLGNNWTQCMVYTRSCKQTILSHAFQSELISAFYARCIQACRRKVLNISLKIDKKQPQVPSCHCIHTGTCPTSSWTVADCCGLFLDKQADLFRRTWWRGTMMTV